MILLLLLALQSDPADLVRRLGSDVAETRAEAARRLGELGPAAVPALRKAAAEGDAEVRSRAAEILEQIARRDRVRPLVERKGPATVALRDVPFKQAVEKTLSAFGPVDLAVDAGLADRKVTMTVERATYWEAVAALEKAASARLDLFSMRWTEGEAVAGSLRSGTGDIQVRCTGWRRPGQPGQNDDRPMIYLEAWFAPGLWAPEMEAGAVEVTDDQGRVVPAEMEVDAVGRRAWGRPNRLGQAGVALDPRALRGARSFSIRGTLRAGFPRDVERIVAPTTSFPAIAKVRDGEVRIEKLEVAEPGQWRYRVSGSAGRQPFDYLLSLEDADGSWLGDLEAGSRSPESEGGSETTVEAFRTWPVRMAVYRPIGTDKVEIPFTLKVAPAPP